MRWSPEPPNVGPLEGFDNTDLFQYRSFGEHLAKLIGALEDNPVLVLDGPWGSGKTTFACQLAGLLRQQGHAVVYFDAFAADHHKDPFLALAEEIHHLATTNDVKIDSDTLSRYIRAAVDVAKELGLTIAETALPVLGRLLREAVEADSRDRASLLENWIRHAAIRKEAIACFRKCLADVAEALTTPSAGSNEKRASTSESVARNGRRLVFIVDELDRCRPTFALDVLERIKHIFGVRGVTFLLVANLKELGKSVLKVYGDVDATRYLEKFFEIVVRLPHSSAHGDNLTIRAYVHHLAQQLKLAWSPFYGGSDLDLLCALAEAENLSLRSLEHAMRLALVLAPTAERNLIALLPILRVSRPALFARILQTDEDPLTEEEKSELDELVNHISDRSARDSLRMLVLNGKLAHFARCLDQYRVR